MTRQLLWEIGRARLRAAGYRVDYTPTSLRVTMLKSPWTTKGVTIRGGRVSERSVMQLVRKAEL